MYKRLTCSSADNTKTVLLNDFNLICKKENVYIPQQVLINNDSFETSFVLREADVLFNRARKLFRITEDILLDNIITNCDVNAGRNHVVDTLTACRYNILLQQENGRPDAIDELLQHLQHLISSIVPIREHNESTVNKLISNNIQNNNLPTSQYFHLYFDVHWLSLTLYYLCPEGKDFVIALLKKVITDLIFVAKVLYDKNGTNCSPFICSCIEALWISLEQFAGSLKKFWTIFNEIIKDYDSVFALWLLQHIVSASDNSTIDNLELVEEILRSTLKNDCAESTIMQMLQIIKPLLMRAWLQSSRIDPYLILWEYFFRRLNTIPTSIPSTMADFMEFVNETDESSNCNSYQFFIILLLNHLRTHPAHWSKLKGRVYSRLPPHKFAELSKIGVFNISLLFLHLMDINFDELSKKFFELLANASKSNQELLAMIYMALIKKHIIKDKPIDKIIEPVCRVLQDSSLNRSNFHIIRNVIEGFEHVLNVSTNYQLKQYKILGNWLAKYASSCPYADLCYLLNVLIWIFERVDRSDDYYEWTSSYSNIVLPAIKPLVTGPNSPPQLGKLLALILKSSSDKTEIIAHFNNYSISPKVLGQFLSTMLEDGPEKMWAVPASCEVVIAQLWVNCQLLDVEIQAHVTRKLLNFDTFSTLGSSAGYETDAWLHLLKSIERSRTSTYTLKNLCESVFGHLDGFIRHLLNSLSADVSSASNFTQLFLRVAQLFRHCSTFMYDKSKSNCLLSRLISLVVLPTEVLMGKPPKSAIQRAVEANYSLFVQGLFKLDYKNDPYVERTLKDLIIKYVPHFSTSNSPILCCFDDESTAAFALDKINRNFLVHSSKCPEEGTFKALKILQVAVEQCTTEAVMKSIATVALPGILEVVMYNGNKTLAVELIKTLVLSDWCALIGEEVKQSVKYVMERNLAFNASNFFQMMILLTKLIPVIVRALLPDIKKQIVTVEKMRGVGYDNTLRNGLLKIETSLSN